MFLFRIFHLQIASHAVEMWLALFGLFVFPL